MGLLRSLAMLGLVLIIWVDHLPYLMAQSTDESSSSARSLDVLLQDYAYRAFGSLPKTGKPYDGVVPSNLTGIGISALRLRSGSLRRYGVDMYNEFQIPVGIISSPYTERLVLVYQNLGNWSAFYYPLDGHSYLAPVLGLLAYNGSNLSATNLTELDIRASGDPILIKFHDLRTAPDGAEAKCVWFGLDGSVNFSNLAEGNVCSTIQQGHFSIVFESLAPSPSPILPPPIPIPPNAGPTPSMHERKSHNKRDWIIAGPVLGGLALLAFMSLLVLWVHKYKREKKIQQMERTAEVGEALDMTIVGDTKAPTAMVTRTQPSLEHEYAP